MALNSTEQQKLEQLQAELRLRGARWEAGETSLLQLPEAERIVRLGANDEPNDIPNSQRELVSKSNFETYIASINTGESFTAPISFDWRNVNGLSYVSAVKDQGSCGSCVAFGTNATIDAAMRIAASMPVGSAIDCLQDLSEAQMFYCGGGAAGAKCSTGWNVTSALSYAKTTGLVPESIYPYQTSNQTCNLPNGWQSYITSISGNVSFRSIADMKAYIANSGTLITTFGVQNAFFSYSNGVYESDNSNYVGYHCVTVVGYDDTQKAWICKNSWGTGWGMGGFFLIGYGQCGIDAYMWGVNSFSTMFPFPQAPRSFMLILQSDGAQTWSPYNPNTYAGWYNGDKLTIQASFNLNPASMPDASQYNGLIVGATSITNTTQIASLQSQIAALTGNSGKLLSGITSGAASVSNLFYNATSTTITLPLSPSSRGTLSNYVYQYTMTYNGNNTVVNTENQAVIVFGCGYQISGTTT